MSRSRRLLAGLATVIALALLSELVLPTDTSLGNFLASTGLGLFLMFVAGGYVARSGFILPALLYAAIAWTGSVYIAWRIAAAVEGLAFTDVAIANLPNLLLYTLAAIAGAAVGMWLYAFRSSLWLLDH